MKYALLVVALLLVVAQGAMAAAPVAAFTKDKTGGVTPLTVTFTDTTTNTPTGWAWLFGDEVWSDKAQYQQTASAAFSQRAGQSMVMIANGSLVLMGGYAGGATNTSWYSSNNGASWTNVTVNGFWTARYGATAVALTDGSIVLMGGTGTSPTLKNDTWRSTDGGARWTQQNSSSGWTARQYPTSVVLNDGSIILAGGGTTGAYKNDVWRSTDNGATWTLRNASSGWAVRYGQSMVVTSDDAIYIYGGYDETTYYRDVWRSIDKGSTWTQMTAAAGWDARYGATAAAMPDGSLIITGGAYSGGYKRDTWRSTNNGASWTSINTTSGWSARNTASMVTLKNLSFVVCAGYTGAWTNDCWITAAPSGSTTQNPSHIFTTGNYSVGLQAYNADGVNSTFLKTHWVNVTASGIYPIANFTAVPSTGVVPLPVTFTDTSTNSPTKWGWYFGDETMSFSPSQTSATAGWTARAGHRSSFTLDDQLVLTAGHTSGSVGDVWITTNNGYTWTQQTALASFGARYCHDQVTLSSGRILVVGGYTTVDKNDVWASDDKGITWTQLNASAGWSPRNSHSIDVLPDDTIVLTGGYSAGVEYSDVWASTDGGTTWYLKTNTPGWNARSSHDLVALKDGSIVLAAGYNSSAGGIYYHDVWRSTDKGATWTEMTAAAGWAARFCPTMVSLPDNSIIINGGTILIGSSYAQDTWRSTDKGATWSNIAATSMLSYRVDAHTAVSHNGTMVFTGGHTYPSFYDANDAFAFQTASAVTQNTTHTYTTSGNYSVSLIAASTSGVNVTPVGFRYVNTTASLSGNDPDFYAVPTVGTSGSLIHFYNISTLVNTVNMTFNWSFGDGSYSTYVGDVTHIYNQTGVFTVGLNVTTAGGSSYENKSAYIQITSPSTQYFAPRSVGLTTQDWKGNPVPDVSITACPIDFTMPASWTALYYGINVNSTTQCLSGTTGTDGSWVAPMSESVRYNFTFQKFGYFTTYSQNFYPVQTSYIITVPIGVYVTPTPAANYISYALANTTINATHENITLSYKDSSGGSSLVSFTVKDQLGNIKYYGTSSAFGTCWTNFSTVVSHTSGDTLIYNFSATQSQLGYVNVSKTLSWFSTAMAGLCDSNGNCFPPWVGQWLSIAILVGLTATFSILSKKFALIIVPVVAVFLLQYLHWLQPVAPITNTSAIAVFGVLLALGILLYIRDSGKRGGG